MDEKRLEAGAVLSPLDVLRRDGWCQNALFDNGSCCIVGAVIIAEARHMLPIVNQVAWEQYADRCEDSWSAAVRFNNHPDTTFADVELVLEKAQIRFEEQV